LELNSEVLDLIGEDLDFLKVSFIMTNKFKFLNSFIGVLYDEVLFTLGAIT